ncbi:hypothetical protein [Amycolatopsis panacis]|uniref:hypothetical protein n=1 Tax=Amycolatopsis panacis TaxID=2340917 RepID=UPI0013141D55|nr:hypothetical protein [Amycolatopsis panacis]
MTARELLPTASGTRIRAVPRDLLRPSKGRAAGALVVDGSRSPLIHGQTACPATVTQ